MAPGESGRDRRGNRAQEASAARTVDRRAGERTDAPHDHLWLRPLRRRVEPRWRDALRLRPPDRATAFPAHREARPDPRESEARRDAGEARRGDPPGPAPAHAG